MVRWLFAKQFRVGVRFPPFPIMPLTSFHLSELLWRLFYLSLSFSLTFALCLHFILPLLSLLLVVKPTLIATHLFETWWTFLHLSFLLSSWFSFPLLIWQVIQFLTPGLYRFEYLLILKYSGLILVYLMGLPIIFWFVLFPMFWQSISMWSEEFWFLPKISEFFQTAIQSTFLFLILCAVPLGIERIFHYAKGIYFIFIEYRISFYYISAIFWSMITPPDFLIFFIGLCCVVLLIELAVFFHLLTKNDEL